MKTLNKNVLTLLCIAVLTLVPFLGLTDFNTKGEPREAIVAWTMLDTGNWILPQNNGEEFAYKPPLFHWAVAACSAMLGGDVTEFSSRLPSALAAIVTALGTFFFFRRRGSEQTAFLAALLFLTCFEVHRAAVNCRVDMVLTMFIVLAIYALCRWAEGGLRGIPWLGILMMSGGTLTKGPVALLLPCMVGGVWSLVLAERLRWTNTLALAGKYAAVAVAALVLPCLWYWAAWRQGGDQFLYLVYEENVLRFLGKMPYGSHEHGPFYYFPILLAGLLPHTLPVLFGLLGKRRMRLEGGQQTSWRTLPTRLWSRLNHTSRFSILAIAIVFAFYSIPTSKRGVYLLPVYPFAAWLIARFFGWMEEHKPRALRAYYQLLTGLLCVAVVVFLVVQTGLLPEQLAVKLPATDLMAWMKGMRGGELFYAAVVIIALYLFYALHLRLPRLLADVMYSLLVIFLMLDAFLQPGLLSAKSDKPLAADVTAWTKKGPTYQYVDDAGNMMHYFTLNFYTGNRLQPFPTGATSERFSKKKVDPPVSGYLLTGEKDGTTFRTQHPQYDFHLVRDYGHRSCDTKQNLQMWQFCRRSQD